MLYLLPLVFFFAICYGDDSYKALDALNLDLYVGNWYEVYQNNIDKTFQGNGRCATATYNFLKNGSISILNKQILNDKIDSITGYGYYKDGDTGGYLTIKLEDNIEAPYWVLSVGPVVDDKYSYSIISDNKKITLFVLTRDVDLFYKKYDSEVLKQIDEFGFTKNYNKPIYMNQTDCDINI